MKFDKDLFLVNKIAAKYFLAETTASAQQALKNAPVKLLTKINDEINNKTLALAHKIVKLKTRAERNVALTKVPKHRRDYVKSTVISIFEQSKSENFRGN